jgi:ankyrin repeat protein
MCRLQSEEADVKIINLVKQYGTPDLLNFKVKIGQRTCLITACQEGRAGVVEAILAKGADVTLTSGSGSTALHKSAENGMDTTVQLLVESGADINAKDNDGKTALDRAV